MNKSGDDREVIPSGKQPMWDHSHMVPIARFLIEERGHMAIEVPGEYGFVDSMVGKLCNLTRTITQEDWEAINKRFVLPDTIGFFGGLIRDNLNGVQLQGHDELLGDDGPEPIEVWEARLRGEGT